MPSTFAGPVFKLSHSVNVLLIPTDKVESLLLLLETIFCLDFQDSYRSTGNEVKFALKLTTSLSDLLKYEKVLVHTQYYFAGVKSFKIKRSRNSF